MENENQYAPSFIYEVRCLHSDATEKWHEKTHNLVTAAGKTDIINKYFLGSGYTAGWYLGLKSAGTVAAGDILSLHGGWAEITPYSGNRPAISFGTTTSGSNTASAISISINATATISGAFICSVNSGNSGVLYSVSDFSVTRSVANGDTLTIIPTISVS